MKEHNTKNQEKNCETNPCAQEESINMMIPFSVLKIPSSGGIRKAIPFSYPLVLSFSVLIFGNIHVID